MWARVLPCVNVCVVFLHKCSLLCSFISFQFSSALLFSLPPAHFLLFCTTQICSAVIFRIPYVTNNNRNSFHAYFVVCTLLNKKKSVFSSKKRTFGVFLPNHYIRWDWQMLLHRLCLTACLPACLTAYRIIFSISFRAFSVSLPHLRIHEAFNMWMIIKTSPITSDVGCAHPWAQLKQHDILKVQAFLFNLPPPKNPHEREPWKKNFETYTTLRVELSERATPS